MDISIIASGQKKNIVDGPNATDKRYLKLQI